MTQIRTTFINIYTLGLCLFCSFHFYAQINEQATERLNRFMQESCQTTYEEIVPGVTSKILKYPVYYITRETKNMYGRKENASSRFIVIDTGDHVKTFEPIKTNTNLPELYGYIQQDFLLNEQSAPEFEALLDVIYPIESWKPDKREFFLKDGKWYFLRDAYFRTKQGFEVSVDINGKITGIRYKMKWDENEKS
jgi:hypothetical protein